MSIHQTARINVLASIASGSRLLRCGLATLLLAVPFCGQLAMAADQGPMDAQVQLTPLQPDSGSITADPGKDVTLAAIEKIGGRGISGQKVAWTVTGPGTANLKPATSTTTAQSATSDAGIASTVFHAGSPGAYEVTATTQKNPGCGTPSCATYVSTRISVNVSMGASADSPDASSGSSPSSGLTRNETIVAAAVLGAGVLIAANDNGSSKRTPAPVLLNLTRESGNNQTANANSPLAQPLEVLVGSNFGNAAGASVQWTTSGGAVLSASQSQSDASGIASIRIVNVGPGPGPITVTASLSDNSAVSVSFTVNIIPPPQPSLQMISGNFQSAFVNSRIAQPLVVEAKLGTSPQANIPIVWAVTGGDASITSVSNGGKTGSNGESQSFVTFGATPGSVEVTATRNDGTGLSQTFQLTSTLTDTLTYVSGGNQISGPNKALPQRLVVLAQTNGRNAANITINWSASNGATLSSLSTVTTGNGQAQVRVTNMGNSLGPVIVTATRSDDPSASVQFTENILPPTLSYVSGGNQSGLIDSPATAPLVVNLVDGNGVPMSGQAVTWTVIGNSATVSPQSSTTIGNGNAATSLTYGSTPGQFTVQASFGNSSVQFTETAVTANGITVSGGGQSGNPGTQIPITVTIQPPPGSTTVSNIPIVFSVVPGKATATLPGGGTQITVPTNSSGSANTTVTLGPTPGPVKIMVQVSGGNPSTTFTETVNGSFVATTLTAVSGAGQIIAPNSPSKKSLVVQLEDNGQPLVGQTITWTSAPSGTVSASSSVTDGAGKANITVTPTATGPFKVTANFAGYAQYNASSAVFSENTTLGTLSSLTSNVQSVGMALDSACASLQGIANRTPQQQDLLNQCLALNASSVVSTVATTSALTQLTPTVAETQTQTSSTATTTQFDNLSGRMNALRGGVQGMSLGGLTFVGPNGSLPIFDVGSALLGASNDPSKKDDESNSFSRWGLFVSGQIGRTDASAQSLTPAYNLDTSGITVGVDYRVNDGLVMGGAFGYSRQITDLYGGVGNLSMTGWSLSGYATWYRKDDWYIDSSVSWSNNTFDSQRLIDYSLPLPSGSTENVDQTATASSGGDTVAGSVTFGRDFHQKAVAYGFYGKLQYSHEEFDAFQEQLDQALPGSGLGLRVDSRTNTSLDSVLGAKIDFTHSTNWGVLIPHAEAEWQHEFRTDPSTFQAFFIDDPTNTPILIQGNELDDNFFRLGVGLSVVLPQGRSAFLLYDRTIGRQGITEYNLSLGFRLEF